MLGTIERALSSVAALCVVGLCVVITGTVLTRGLLGWSIPDDVTIVRELMIGAIVLTLRQREGVKKQSIARQIARTREESVEVKNVPSGSGV